MEIKEMQRLQVGHLASGADASNFGSVLISTIIVGFALIIIGIFASFALLIKNTIK
jgi:hypothetical protein